MKVVGIDNNKFRNWDIKKDTFETNKIRETEKNARKPCG